LVHAVVKYSAYLPCQSLVDLLCCRWLMLVSVRVRVLVIGRAALDSKVAYMPRNDAPPTACTHHGVSARNSHIYAASPWRCSGVEACQKSVTLDQERKRLRSSRGFFFSVGVSPILHGEDGPKESFTRPVLQGPTQHQEARNSTKRPSMVCTSVWTKSLF
jgi:hypothetical protein